MDIFLGDAMGPDEGGQPAHIPLEHALVDGEVEDVTRQNDRILVVVADDGVNRRGVAIDIVGVQLLLLLQRRRFLESLVGLELVNGAVGGFVVRVQYLVVFVCFVVVLSHSAYLFTCHADDRSVTLLGLSKYWSAGCRGDNVRIQAMPNDLLIHLNRKRVMFS